MSRARLWVHQPARGRSALAILRAFTAGARARNSAHQAALIETLLPALTLDVTQKIADAAALFPNAPREIWLEIGFGGGEHLIAEANAHKDCGFIGCEPFENGVARPWRWRRRRRSPISVSFRVMPAR